METLGSHFYNWFGVLFFMVLYSAVLLFVLFYRKMDRKPTGTYFAFLIAFAIEMHGIPLSEEDIYKEWGQYIEKHS